MKWNDFKNKLPKPDKYEVYRSDLKYLMNTLYVNNLIHTIIIIFIFL